MRGINLCFDYEDDEIKTRICYPEKVIELSREQFSQFQSRPHEDYDFIDENKELMDDSDGKNYYGILLMNKETDDGIFVMETPFKREVAYIPYARYYLEKEQYPALSEYCRRITKVVDEQVAKALNQQREGRYQIRMKALCNGNNNGFSLDENLFLSMMQNRDEFEYAEGGWDDEEDVVFLGIARDHVKFEDDTGLWPVSQIDVDIACARHTLWLNNAGGKQADFSKCILRNIDLSRAHLAHSIFDGAKLVDCSLSGVDFSSTSFVGANIINCDSFSITAEGSDFSKAQISLMDLSGCNFENCNFTDAIFRGCGIYSVDFDNSCLDKTDFTDSTIVSSKTTECFFDEEDWLLSMNGFKEQTQGGQA